MEQLIVIPEPKHPHGNMHHVCVYMGDTPKLRVFDINNTVEQALWREDGVYVANSIPPHCGYIRTGGVVLGDIRYFVDHEGQAFGVMADDNNLEYFKTYLVEYSIAQQVETVRKRKRELRKQRNILDGLNEILEKCEEQNA